jgi:nuclear transport factor 2 (NTF2) superfamily protein
MKHLLIIFSLLLTSGSWCDLTEITNISLHNKLENYKWKKRILLLITKEEDTVLVNHVNKFFITHKCKNNQRNLELIKFKKGNTYNKKITSNFKDKTGIWLIGYDGNIKAYTENNALLLNLHDLIDNMPIRKEEMKELKKNC